MLLLINGAPGAGKSTLAQRYAGEHTLALIVEVDSLRMQLGQWSDNEESKLVARELTLALADAHLRTGRDVIVPQYLGRPEFRERLRDLAAENHTPFVEVVLTDRNDRIVQQFRRRRAEHARAGVAHPESDLGDDAVATEVEAANAALVRDASTRGVPVVSATDDPYAALVAAVSHVSGGTPDLGDSIRRDRR